MHISRLYNIYVLKLTIIASYINKIIISSLKEFQFL